MLCDGRGGSCTYVAGNVIAPTTGLSFIFALLTTSTQCLYTCLHNTALMMACRMKESASYNRTYERAHSIRDPVNILSESDRQPPMQH